VHSKLAYLRFCSASVASALLHRRSLSCLWELTYRCNARCAICAYWRRPSRIDDELTLAEIKEGLDRIHRHGCRFVNFTGGEPTIRRDLEDIVRHASSLSMWTSLVTNGGLLTRDRVRSLRQAGLDSMLVSLDSPDPATHDRIRGVPNLHARAVATLRVMSEEFATGLRIGGVMCVLAPHNVAALRDVVALARELGVYVLFQPYHDRKTGSREFCPRITASLAAEIRELGRTSGNILNSPHYLGGIARYAEGRKLPACHAGRKYFSIDPFGYVHPCVDLPAVGHLLRDPLSVVGGERARAEVRKCAGCWYCFRGEADASLQVAGWLNRLALGVRVFRHNRAKRPHAAPGVAVPRLEEMRPWTPGS
jgi:MoaA/NifB/PqqE/SkfB family radical SAM enzyme